MAGSNGAGWVKLWRKAEVSLIPNADRFQLAGWLWVRAARDAVRVAWDQDPLVAVDLQPGQLVLSQREVAKRLNRSRASIQRDLAWMARERMISQQQLFTPKGDAWATLVTVLNWHLYQQDAVGPEAATASREFIDAVLADLNATLAAAGIQSGFRGGREFDKLVRDRVRLDGATLEQFRHVHRVKTAEWAGTDQAVFLRPSTLYIPKHWSDYRDQAETGQAVPWKPPSLSRAAPGAPRTGGDDRSVHPAPERPPAGPQGALPLNHPRKGEP